MSYIKVIFLISYIIQNIICDDIIKLDNRNITAYKGESFPNKYLLPEEYFASSTDLDYYIKKLQRTVTYFHKELIHYNDTEVNRALGMFFMKAVLKRAIRDHRDRLTIANYGILKDLIKKGDFLVSHYVYMAKQSLFNYSNNELESRVARLISDDSTHVYSIGDFNNGRLQKWILSNHSMHAYVEKMDNITLTRDQYAYITERMDSFFINVETSDECFSRVVYNAEPIIFSELRPCVPDPYCRKALLSSPSVVYALSHRLLNILMLRHSRRCYIQTEREDAELMDSLCAFMYREAVFIARKGFFARDVFLEHVALCSLLGYEEFFRQRWFRKAVSWMNDQGCIYESRNFLINRSSLQIEEEKDMKIRDRLRKRLKLSLLQECHSHPMALLIIVLAQAVRYTLNSITK